MPQGGRDEAHGDLLRQEGCGGRECQAVASGGGGSVCEEAGGVGGSGAADGIVVIVTHGNVFIYASLPDVEKGLSDVVVMLDLIVVGTQVKAERVPLEPFSSRC